LFLRATTLGSAAAACVALATSTGVAPVRSADPDPFRVVMPALSAAKLPPPPPAPAFIPQTIVLPSGGVTMSPPVEARHTILVSGKEFFDVPSHPALVAWYDRFGTIGKGGSNTLFAAHINYLGYGAGPFARLTRSKVGDTLTVVAADGRRLAFSVQSVSVLKVGAIDMNAVVYPALAANKERVTLITCGGTFVPNASGSGGQYDSRVLLVAERYVD
jgi:hypothetical protein